MKNIDLLLTTILLAPDGAGGGDPALLNLDAVGKYLSNRIIAIQEIDKPEREPQNPDRPRMYNFPKFDTTDVNFAGYTSLQSLCEAVSTQQKAIAEANKLAGKKGPSQFLKVVCHTDKQIIELRPFSFDELDTEGYMSCQITRLTKVAGLESASGSMRYGKRIHETSTTTQPEQKKAEEPAKAPAKAPGL